MMIERNIKTVIVTGPTGAVGTALCSRLLQAGCTVVAVCRPGSPRAVALPKDANLYVVACDAANLADLPQCMACLLYTSPSPRDMRRSRMPSSA